MKLLSLTGDVEIRDNVGGCLRILRSPEEGAARSPSGMVDLQPSETSP